VTPGRRDFERSPRRCLAANVLEVGAERGDQRGKGDGARWFVVTAQGVEQITDARDGPRRDPVDQRGFSSVPFRDDGAREPQGVNSDQSREYAANCVNGPGER
jgi:hypothetical protein